MNSSAERSTPPLPPVELRLLVGSADEEFWGNPSGRRVFPDLPESADDWVLDFGCGCGRLARQLMQQARPPGRYLGLDLHAGLVQWCAKNLAPAAPGFEFRHHDVFNLGFNPTGSRTPLAFPAGDGAASLLIAWSVFTHLLEADASFYLREVARVLRGDGVAVTTWLLFDKRDFPVMQEFQNALFINDVDPTNAVYFDRDWVLRALDASGLVVSRVRPPGVRGFQWVLELRHAGPGDRHAAFPADDAPFGLARPPVLPLNPDRIGLG